MTYVWPSNDLQDSKKILGLLGSFWSEVYTGKELVEDIVKVNARLAEQSHEHFTEMVATNSRYKIPLAHKEKWHAITIKQTDVNAGDAGMWRFDDPNVGNFDESWSFAFNTPLPATEYAIPLPAKLTNVNLIQDTLTTPTTVLHKNIDFKIDIKNQELLFRTNPFDNTDITQEPVFEDGVVATHEITLWLFNAEFDHDYIYEHAGYVINTKDESSSEYRDAVNAVLDAIAGCTGLEQVENLISAYTGVPLVKENTETVEDIYYTANATFVLTDKNVYRFTSRATVGVAVGDVVYKGDSLVKEFNKIAMNRGRITGQYGEAVDYTAIFNQYVAARQITGKQAFPHNYTLNIPGQIGQLSSLVLAKGMLGPKFHGPLLFTNKDVPLDVDYTRPGTDSDHPYGTSQPIFYRHTPAGSTQPRLIYIDPIIKSFKIIGHPLDAKLFWDTVKSNESIYGKSFNDLVIASTPLLADWPERPFDVSRQIEDITTEAALSTFAWIRGFSRHETALTEKPALVLGVNPLKFLAEHVLRNNAIIFHLQSQIFSDKKLNIDLGVLLRKIVPPNTHVFVVIDLPAGDTSVNMEGADTYGGIVHLTPEHEETAAAIASFSVKPASFTCQ